MTTTTNRVPIDIRRFPWIRRLAADYAFAYDRLAPFFSGNPTAPAAWRKVIAQTQRHRRDRAGIADVLAAQQQHRGAPPEARAAAARLREPDTVAIVTGQQAGLAGGPLFTLLKALTAIRLAEQVTSEHGVPAVAIFWIDAEDHDWDEVRRCAVLDGELVPATVDAGAPEGAYQQPVARVRLDAAVTEALARLQTLLPQTEFSAQLTADLTAAYRPGIGMADAFGRWLESVLGSRGLVVFDSSDPAAKPLVAGLFVQEIEHAGQTSQLAGDAGERLQALGYHAQVTAQPDQVALFHLNTGRNGIRVENGGFVVGERALPRDAMVELARTRPHEFSPNVLLRPLVQDTLFPTACYVAGPSELAYLAQIGQVYAARGIPMPLMYPRATATFLDANATRFLSKQDVAFEALQAQDEAALNQLLAAQLPASVERTHDDASREIADRMEALAAAASQVDTTLEGAARSTLGRMQDDLKKLHGKIVQAAKRKDDTLRRQFMHARAQAFPDGHPQERSVGFVYFLNKYGPGFVDRLCADLPLELGTHWVISP